MPSFGEQLKRAREKRSISLDDISISTKISTRMLRALEEDHFDQLPGGIFNKGFVRAYARCVGLDENQTVADYLVASGEEQAGPVALPEPAPRKSEPDPAPEQKPEKPWSIPWGPLGIVLLLAAFALAFWQKRVHQSETESASTPTAVTASPPAQSVPGPSQVSPASETSSQPPATAPAAQATSSPKSSTGEASPGSVVLGSTAANNPTPAQISILIKAREECWISATVDGNTVFEGTLPAAGTKKVSGQHRAVIKAGNAGAVDLFFNGNKVPTDGQEGEVKAFSFDQNGLSTITSTASPGHP